METRRSAVLILSLLLPGAGGAAAQQVTYTLQPGSLALTSSDCTATTPTPATMTSSGALNFTFSVSGCNSAGFGGTSGTVNLSFAPSIAGTLVSGGLQVTSGVFSGSLTATEFNTQSTYGSNVSVAFADGNIGLGATPQCLAYQPVTISPGQATGSVTLSPCNPGEIDNVTTGVAQIQIFFQVEAGIEISGSVNYNLGSNSSPALSLTDTTLPFSVNAGASPTSQSVGVVNNGSGSLGWSAAVDPAAASWLSVEPSSGTTSPNSQSNVNVNVDPTNLTTSNSPYTGTVTFTGGGATATLTVTVTVQSQLLSVSNTYPLTGGYLDQVRYNQASTIVSYTLPNTTAQQLGGSANLHLLLFDDQGNQLAISPAESVTSGSGSIPMSVTVPANLSSAVKQLTVAAGLIQPSMDNGQAPLSSYFAQTTVGTYTPGMPSLSLTLGDASTKYVIAEGQVSLQVSYSLQSAGDAQFSLTGKSGGSGVFPVEITQPAGTNRSFTEQIEGLPGLGQYQVIMFTAEGQNYSATLTPDVEYLNPTDCAATISNGTANVKCDGGYNIPVAALENNPSIDAVYNVYYQTQGGAS